MVDLEARPISDHPPARIAPVGDSPGIVASTIASMPSMHESGQNTLMRKGAPLKRSMWAGLLAAALVPGLATAADGAKDGGLARKGFLGVKVAPLSPSAKKEAKFEGQGGVLVDGSAPGSAAEKGGFKKGDILTTLNGKTIPDVPGIVQQMAANPGGAKLTFGLVREGKPQELTIEIPEKPREVADAYDVIYDAVQTKTGKVRTIVTRPKGAKGKLPALLVIQGLGMFTMDRPLKDKAGVYEDVIESIASSGYVTMRVEKPGVGDSEGGPLGDVTFDAELDGFRQALKALKAYDFVDAKNVVVFGHSMGGVMGPIVVGENPVKGLIVYGTVFKTWTEYELENVRRQMALAGADSIDIDNYLRQHARYLNALIAEKKDPKAIATAYPDLAPLLREASPDGVHIYTRHYSFFQHLGNLNMPEQWRKVDTNVLALWGKSEYVSTEADHRMIADYVNQHHAGKGTFLALDRMDHSFQETDGPEDAHQSAGQTKTNPRIKAVLKEWLDRWTKS